MDAQRSASFACASAPHRMRTASTAARAAGTSVHSAPSAASTPSRRAVTSDHRNAGSGRCTYARNACASSTRLGTGDATSVAPGAPSVRPSRTCWRPATAVHSVPRTSAAVSSGRSLSDAMIRYGWTLPGAAAIMR